MTTSAKKMCDRLEINDIRQNILVVGGGQMELWARAVVCDERLFNQLFQFIFSDDQRLAWRSCWIIDNASEKFPHLLKAKLPEIIAAFLSATNGSLKRHFTRILCRYNIPEQYLGAIVNRCFELLVPSEPAAVRVNAMQILFNLTLTEPDLKGELISVLERLIEVGGSAGFINRSGKLLSQLRS